MTIQHSRCEVCEGTGNEKFYQEFFSAHGTNCPTNITTRRRKCTACDGKGYHASEKADR